MAACPKCKNKIRFHTVLFALCPVWIKCPSCSTRLTGNILVEIQAFFVFMISLVGGAVLVSVWEKFDLSLPGRSLLFAGAVFSLVIPNVYVTLKYGDFRERG